jgi:hypothetical protein
MRSYGFQRPAAISLGFMNRLLVFFSPRFSLKDEMAGILRNREMWFDVFIQRYVDERTPVEDTLTEWKESVSELEHVAKVIIPTQDLESFDRDQLCERLSFNPWHGLPEHKPLGVVNRARRTIYQRMSEYRHQLNRAPMEEPR